ncbi:MAG: 50S ribosomal protein L24 [Paracoccaceae bacterium]|jgi:large subunit ribosomal protein L24|nr:50S ribosomal protein L24 [Paracoccaceae bacterium]|tara:strand:- start:180 stop:494 length:315 start_codon:yes stop_codon:yes gene_type:complete
MASKLRKGDKVIVLSGKDKSKTGEITKVVTKARKAFVSGINTAIRHTKQTQNTQGGKVPKEMPIDLSNVALVDPKDGGPTRVGFKFVEGKKVRYAKKSGETIND